MTYWWGVTGNATIIFASFGGVIMVLNVDLAPQEQAWVESEARQLGLPPSDFVRRIIAESAAKAIVSIDAKPAISAKNQAAIDMLNEWIAEDATDDPEEIRKASEDVTDLVRNLNANRAATGERLVFREPTHPA